jgi:hypothetical protein
MFCCSNSFNCALLVMNAGINASYSATVSGVLPSSWPKVSAIIASDFLIGDLANVVAGQSQRMN